MLDSPNGKGQLDPPAPNGAGCARSRGTAEGLRDIGGDALRGEHETPLALHLAMESARLGTWEWTIDSGRVEWSAGLARMLGLEPTSATGTLEDALRLVHPDDAQAVREAFRAAIEDAAELHTVCRVTPPDGRERWLETRAVAVLDEDGAAVSMVGTCGDVTERKLSEEALRHSELRYRRLLQALPVAVYACDEQGRITLYNDAAAELWGQKPRLGVDEWCGARRVIGEDGGEISLSECPMAVTVRTGAAVRGREVIIERPDGTRRTVLPHPEPLFDPTGRITGAVCTLVDITPVRQAAEMVRISEERFRFLADASPTLIWVAGTDKRCEWFNKPWLEFRGRTLEQELRGGWLEGVHPDDREGATALYSEAFDARREFQIEYRLRRADGQYRWILDMGRPLYGPGGVFTGYIGSCVDITDQALARQSLERQQTLLEDAVAARTEELQQSNERLRIAERMAALGTLSAGLGHDMGNLLVPVRVRLESLSQADLPAAVHEDIEAIRSAATYLQRLAGGLRLLAIDPASAVATEVTEVSGWWEEVSPLLRNGLPRGATLESDLAECKLNIAVPRATITQIVFNLVQNAGDAIRGRGQGVVRVHASRLDDRFISLRVSDDGPGMKPEVRSRCMEPFFTTKARGLSTGLGLALVYGLVERVGGSIDVDSKEGVGTTFELRLPLASQSAGTVRPGAGKRAVVNIKDVRLRAFVHSELKSMSFEIGQAGDDAHGAALAVWDELPEAAGVAAGATPAILPSSDKQQVIVVVGAKPGVGAIRDVLGKAAREAAHGA